MKILINDANILIDLIELDLLQEFSLLDFEMCTTDFILAEIEDAQKVRIDRIIDAGHLTVIVTERDEDFEGINGLLETGGGLSVEDCSAWYYSRKLGGILVTGDGNLRKMATAAGIEVRGIIYLFDELLAQKIITCPMAVEKIEHLMTINSRLPKDAISTRLRMWKRGKLFVDIAEEE